MTYLRKTVAIATLALATTISLAGCSASTASAPGDQLEIVEDVAFYPACGNETLTLDGTTWYSFQPDDAADFPTPLALASGDWPGPGTSRGVAAVVAPGPGDDKGKLVVYDGGYAYFRSASGEMTTWLTTEEIDYNFVC